MSIEQIIEMLEDCDKLANSKEEAEKLKRIFIKNSKNEYDIIEK